ncbi:penicillin-binding protein 1B [Desulfogranum mediterraneum]|uniref:penicillin-binding protein 1B n=1 Tax=Desulfogranum mediterraneum TaxID=160661 RepID=UPI000413EE67|nr:penicillin-binding protein 1B [Desulfogranum mediterraneum]
MTKARRSLLLKVAAATLLAAVLVFALILLPRLRVLEEKVVSRFQEQRWAIPARIYARPLELYPGKSITPHTLEAELLLGRYQPSAGIDQPGQFHRLGSTFFIKTRPFTFLDGPQAAVAARIDFRDGTITGIRERDSRRALDFLRLDPVTIGSVLPTNNEDRMLLEPEDIPPRFRDILLTIEDRRFYSHHGIDPRGILRALVRNLRAGRTVAGGSTITQQLVKNLFLTHQRTLRRKFTEMVMAVILERHFSKEEILTAYCNEIFLGQEGRRAIHGFALASLFYFQKELDQLSLGQQAMLVGLVKGPSYYTPLRHPQAARARLEVVLKALAESGMISDQERHLAREHPLPRAEKNREAINVVSFIELVLRRLTSSYTQHDLSSRGLQIFTTLDPILQARLSRRFSQTIGSLASGKEKLEGAFVVSSRNSGEIIALGGGRDLAKGDFNRALDGIRQIGSLVKPVVYLTALEQGYGLASILEDTPLSVPIPGQPPWRPANYDHRSHGRVMLYQALAHSLNLATVRLGMELGVERVVANIRRLGVDRSFEPFPSLLLGSLEMSPLEVCQLYQTIADSGFHTPLRVIRGVLDLGDQPLERNPLTINQNFSAQQIYLLQFGLQQTVRSGTAKGLQHLLGPHSSLAGKTGTTNNTRDSWFAGYDGATLGVVWLGNDDASSTGLTGASGALPVWAELMQAKGIQDRPLPPPPGISWQSVSPPMLPGKGPQQQSQIRLPVIDSGAAPSRDPDPPQPHASPTVPEQFLNDVGEALDSILDLFQ